MKNMSDILTKQSLGINYQVNFEFFVVYRIRKMIANKSMTGLMQFARGYMRTNM